MKAQAATGISAIVLHERDDVAVLIKPIGAGELVAVAGARGRLTLRAKAPLPLGHKLALRAMPAGSDIRKYGEVIGRLTADVVAGDHVHVHNLASLRAH
jgi:hypothetical protein